MEKLGYTLSFGMWTVHTGADPFGQAVRPPVSFEDLLTLFHNLGGDAVQFHDDEVVPELETLSPSQIRQQAREVRQKLEDHGLVADLIGARVWEAPLGADGAFTANDPKARAWAMDRAKKAIDIIFELGSDLFVIWYARDGSFVRESKDAIWATQQLVEGLNDLLDYNPDVRVAIEPKPNEPMDQSYCPTIGHALALAAQTNAPDRVGCLVESAHAILAGLDPADEMAFALAFDKLWNVHLNDQNGLKFDQDRSFGAVNLRRAFDQVLMLDDNRYYDTGGTICFDVKALRTQPVALATKHLRNSARMFFRLVELARTVDRSRLDDLRASQDYEEIDWMILDHLMA